MIEHLKHGDTEKCATKNTGPPVKCSPFNYVLSLLFFFFTFAESDLYYFIKYKQSKYRVLN